VRRAQRHLMLSSPGLTGRSNNHHPEEILDCSVKPGNDTGRTGLKRNRFPASVEIAITIVVTATAAEPRHAPAARGKSA
jgi:hypothetical protein